MFKRMWNLIKGMCSGFIGMLESRNPQALLEAERDNISQQLVSFNAGLVNQAALIESLTRQANETGEQVKQLNVHVQHYVGNGDINTAGKLALQLQTAQTRLTQLAIQRASADERLRELERSRDSAMVRVRTKMVKMQEMVNEAEMLNAQADLEESAKSMVDATTTSFDNLNRVEGKIANIRDRAVGRSRIVSGLSNNMDLYDETQKQLESSALQQFLASNATGGKIEAAGVKKEFGSSDILVPNRSR